VRYIEVEKMTINVSKRSKGQVLLLAVAILPIVVGIATLVADLGVLYLTKSQLQTAAEQGALAGCHDLNGGYPSPANASTNGVAYAKNPPGKGSDTVTATVTYNSTQKSVKVDASRTLNLFFAPIFGQHFATVSASAMARLTPTSSIPPGAPPFVIKAPTDIIWQGGPQGDSYSQPYYMKKTPTKAQEFTYVNGVFKNPTSYDDYLDLLADGYSKSVNLNTVMYHIGPATASESAVNSFASRLTAGGNQDILQAKAGDPRLMLIPVVETLSTSTRLWDYSTSGMKIVGFVGFWFDSINKGNLYYVNGSRYYLDYVVTGRFVRVALPTGTGNVVPGQQWYGIGNVQLVE
jgi:hypothetical protein